MKQYITQTKIPIEDILKESHCEKSGALVLFCGDIRNHNDGNEVSYLEYEAQENMAEKSIHEIIEDAKKKWKLNSAYCIHRLGKLDILETAVLVITTSDHRTEAYKANQYIINRVKKETPIWKREFFKDGTSKWGKACEHEFLSEDDCEHHAH